MNTIAITAALSLALLTACGGGGARLPTGTPANPADKVDAAFLAKANTACQPYLDELDASPFPYPNFNPDKPDVSLLPKIGAYFDSLSINHDGPALIKGLGTPAKGQPAWHRLVDLIDQDQVLVVQQIQQAKTSDSADFAANVKALNALQPKLEDAAVDVGFARDSACGLLFG